MMDRQPTRWAVPFSGLARRIRWRSGIRDECAFWRNWLENRGGRWPADFAYRTDPQSELEPHLAERLPSPPPENLEILDVGAGPLTIVGKRIAGRPVHVTAVDPLAEAYNRMLDDLQIRPPVRTQPGAGERLAALLGENRFELVVSINAVDHASDPLLVIRQMLAVAKPGANVILEHTANEGQTNAYAGLHQWNFDVEDGRLILTGRGGRNRTDITRAVGDLAETTCGERIGRIFVTMRKHAS